ncbi:MAG: hypothetical protein OEV50_03185, partial [Candidatus Aminicenantes bacterium]|nr:hypothetical protein [Candidatus Aminicenantes bacterium]
FCVAFLGFASASRRNRQKDCGGQDQKEKREFIHSFLYYKESLLGVYHIVPVCSILYGFK